MVASNGWGTSASKAIPWARFLLVEAAQAAARCNPHWRRRYIHLAMRRHKSIAKVAMGRTLGEFACTRCGGMDVRIRRRSSSVRTWDSSVPDMACSRASCT